MTNNYPFFIVEKIKCFKKKNINYLLEFLKMINQNHSKPLELKKRNKVQGIFYYLIVIYNF